MGAFVDWVLKTTFLVKVTICVVRLALSWNQYDIVRLGKGEEDLVEVGQCFRPIPTLNTKPFEIYNTISEGNISWTGVPTVKLLRRWAR